MKKLFTELIIYCTNILYKYFSIALALSDFFFEPEEFSPAGPERDCRFTKLGIKYGKLLLCFLERLGGKH